MAQTGAYSPAVAYRKLNAITSKFTRQYDTTLRDRRDRGALGYIQAQLHQLHGTELGRGTNRYAEGRACNRTL